MTLERSGVRDILVLKEDETFAKAACGAAPGLAQQHGMQLLDDLTIANVAVDVSSAVDVVKAKAPQAVVGCVYDTVCHALLRLLKERRVKKKRFWHKDSHSRVQKIDFGIRILIRGSRKSILA